MKHLFKISTAVLASALLLSTTAMAANYWTDDVVVEAGKGTPTIDGVYDAAEWSCLVELSRQSAQSGSIPVRIPDFTRGRWKDPNFNK